MHDLRVTYVPSALLGGHVDLRGGEKKWLPVMWAVTSSCAAQCLGGAQAIDTSCRFATVGFSVDSSFLPLKIACLKLDEVLNRSILRKWEGQRKVHRHSVTRSKARLTEQSLIHPPLHPHSLQNFRLHLLPCFQIHNHRVSVPPRGHAWFANRIPLTRIDAIDFFSGVAKIN